MTEKELKRLTRSELLEMLIAQMEENEKLKADLEQAREQAESRRIAIDRAGSIAEAALALNGVFDAAQAAAAQYLENVRQLSGNQEAACRQMEAEAAAKAERICAEAEAYRQKVCAEADEYSRRICGEANQYRKQVAEKIAALLQQKDRLVSMLSPDQGGGPA